VEVPNGNEDVELVETPNGDEDDVVELVKTPNGDEDGVEVDATVGSIENEVDEEVEGFTSLGFPKGEASLEGCGDLPNKEDESLFVENDPKLLLFAG